MVAARTLVFVVDDEEAVRKALRRLLSASGLDARVFADGASFVDAVAVHRPDCLVVDLHMPGMTGLEVLRQLTVLDAKAPVIIMTAHDDPETRARCESAGVGAYLCKPVDATSLLNEITRLTRRL
jgi:FixJ family two-component response regulator